MSNKAGVKLPMPSLGRTPLQRLLSPRLALPSLGLAWLVVRNTLHLHLYAVCCHLYCCPLSAPPPPSLHYKCAWLCGLCACATATRSFNGFRCSWTFDTVQCMCGQCLAPLSVYRCMYVCVWCVCCASIELEEFATHARHIVAATLVVSCCYAKNVASFR